MPLKSPDADVPLNLQAVFEATYDEAAYDISLEYHQPPPPPTLPEADAHWVQSQLKSIQ